MSRSGGGFDHMPLELPDLSTPPGSKPDFPLALSTRFRVAGSTLSVYSLELVATGSRSVLSREPLELLYQSEIFRLLFKVIVLWSTHKSFTSCNLFVDRMHYPPLAPQPYSGSVTTKLSVLIICQTDCFYVVKSACHTLLSRLYECCKNRWLSKKDCVHWQSVMCMYESNLLKDPENWSRD